MGVERGACRIGLFFMCSCSILKSSADRGISPLAAGPISPSNFFVAFRESRFDGFLDVRERLTLLTLNAGANRPLANNFVFHQIADEAPGFPLACQLHLPKRRTRKPSLKKANRSK